MEIKINLKDKKLCDGCPCLQLQKGSNYYAKCGLGYEIERIGITRWEAWEKYRQSSGTHPDLIAFYETTRSKKCIKKYLDDGKSK